MSNDVVSKLILYSGGFDSTVLLLHDIQLGDDVTLMYVDYGQRVAPLEIMYAKYWANKFNLHLEVVKTPNLQWSKSTMVGGEDTGDGWMDEYVEMRNLIFLGYALSYAEAHGIEEVEVGYIDVTPHYPDTSELFVDLINMLGNHTAGISVSAPLHRLSKEEVFNYAKEQGYDLREILDNTITCNVLVEGKPCGKCEGCEEVNNFRELI